MNAIQSFFQEFRQKWLDHSDTRHGEQADSEPPFRWATARFLRKVTDGRLELRMVMPEPDLATSRVKLADSSLILELHYRDTRDGAFCLNDYYRRTVPIDLECSDTNPEVSWQDGELLIGLQLQMPARVRVLPPLVRGQRTA